MRVSEMLDCILRPRLNELARELEIDTWGDKVDLTSRIARSLSKKRVDGEPLGWRGALHFVLQHLEKADLLEILHEFSWICESTAFIARSSVSGLRIEELREMIRELCVRDEDDSGAMLEHYCRTGPFASHLRPVMFDDEEGIRLDEDDLEYEAELEEWEAEPETEPWHRQNTFVAGARTSLPDGLEPVERPLFPHQARSLEKLAAWWRGGTKEGVLCLPTGAGKTRTAVAFALEHVVPDSKRVLWLAHRKELVNQAIASFLENGVNARTTFKLGRYEAGRAKTDAVTDVVVASIPTLGHGRALPNLSRLLRKAARFDLVIMDECHHAVASSWKKLHKEIVKRSPGVKVLGLTATPTRTAVDEQPEFWRMFGGLIHEELVLPLIRDGILARPRVTMVATDRTFEATAKERMLYEKFKFTDIPAPLLARIGSDRDRNALIVKQLADHASRWGQTLVFAATLEQARQIERRLSERGLESRLLHGETRTEIRARDVTDFRAKRYPVLINVSLFTEGTDLPKVETVFIARPSKSAILFQQMVGRGMRGPQLGGTRECNVVGFYDNVVNLMTDQLTSSYRSAMEALEALGLSDDSPVAPSYQPEGLTVASRRVIEPPTVTVLQKRLEQFLAVLDAQDSETGGGATPAANALVGWWEYWARGEWQILPVFADDAMSARARINALMSGRRDASAFSVIPDVYFAKFARPFATREGDPRYVDLTKVLPEEARTVAKRCLDASSDELKAEMFPGGIVASARARLATQGAPASPLPLAGITPKALRAELARSPTADRAESLRICQRNTQLIHPRGAHTDPPGADQSSARASFAPFLSAVRLRVARVR